MTSCKCFLLTVRIYYPRLPGHSRSLSKAQRELEALDIDVVACQE